MRRRRVIHNITQFGSYCAFDLFFHRHRSRHIDRSRTNSSLSGPTWAPAGVHLGGEDSGAATQNAIYCISLLIITHHYAIHYSSLLIIAQTALLIITHHYTTSVGSKMYCVVWRFHATKLCILSHYAWKSREGAAPPPRFLCVMMSKKEIYE